MSDQLAIAVLTMASSVIGSVLLVFGVQRLQAKTEAKKGDADALRVVQEVLANVGGVYDQLIDHVRESVESQIELKYKVQIDVLTQKVSSLESSLQLEHQAREADRQQWLEERREWENGIGRLLAQIGRMKQTPEWQPRTRNTPDPAADKPHGFRT